MPGKAAGMGSRATLAQARRGRVAGAGGFSVLAERDLPEIGGVATLHRHRPTGARLVTIKDGAPDHVFAIAFPTVPEDDTGVAHILEHAVLCGSARYALRKPFAHLLRSSLHTYLNASTLPDMTVYPVASRNAADFANLMDVYLDAVFFPMLTEETFLQEGWRLEPGEGGAATIQGVVYNEMKGMAAVPSHVLEETLRRALFPATVYARAYAGDPDAIPLLDRSGLVDFHRRHYAPAAALAFLSGPGLDAAMERLGAVLQRAAERACSVPPAPLGGSRPMAAPHRVDAAYSGAHDAFRLDGRVAVAWGMDSGMPPDQRIASKVLVRLLTGSPAAPLRRALVDGGLGAELAHCGFAGRRLWPGVQFGVAGVDPARAGEVEAALLATLADIASGRHETDVAAAIDGEEFSRREAPSGHAPPGIARMMTALPELRHGRDPLAALAFADALDSLRRAQAHGERPLAAVAAALLATPLRVVAVVQADPGLAAEQARRARQMAAGLARRDGPAAVAARSAALRKAQETADPPEALAALPVLGLSDIPAVEPVEPVEVASEAPPLLLQACRTHGIVQLDIALDLSHLPTESLSAAALLGPALLGSGTARRDRDALARWIAAETGGFWTETWSAPTREGGAATRLVLRGKALAGKADALFAIAAELLGEPCLDAPGRLREVVLAELSRHGAALLPHAHDIVDRRLRAGLGEAGRRDEALNGLSRLRYLHALNCSAELEALGAHLAALLRAARSRPAAVSVAADVASLGRLREAAEALARGLLDSPPNARNSLKRTLTGRRWKRW
jgi:presequence protease